jgi:hypothetical protein
VRRAASGLGLFDLAVVRVSAQIRIGPRSVSTLEAHSPFEKISKVVVRIPPEKRMNNPTGMYEGSSRKAIGAFKAVLDRSGVPATVRLTRGREIAAACGQLAATG